MGFGLRGLGLGCSVRALVLMDRVSALRAFKALATVTCLSEVLGDCSP